ncbi:MAG: diadenylate cyclase CdaA [Desulfovibrionaceae bacterium]
MNTFMHMPSTWRDFLDILLVTVLVYQIILWLRDTRALSAIYGILLLGMLYITSIYTELYTFTWLLENFFGSLFLVIVILFQQDIRRALSLMGSQSFFLRHKDKDTSQEKSVQILSETLWYLSQRRIGALIVLEGNTALGDTITGGVILNAVLSQQLLITIFMNGTPLHDGAIVIRNNIIAAAACILPLANVVGQNFGTRHRAAIGITEETDAIVLVVSEEKGTVSIAHRGTLRVIEASLLAQELKKCWEA